MERQSMKTIILRILAALLSCFFAFMSYSYYTDPVGANGRISALFTNVFCCFLFLHFAVTGSRKIL